MSVLLLLGTLAGPARSQGLQWPWSKPHELTAQCSVEPSPLEQGSQARLRARIEATDSRGHPLAYAWSTNGGKLAGDGAEVEVEASELLPGVYSVAAVAQDAYNRQARCAASFQVLPAVNRLAMGCTVEPSVVQAGTPARLRAEASDTLGHSLRYRWFTNGGQIHEQEAEASLDTTGLRPGLYSITGRVEDERGGATDCVLLVEVEPPPPPPEAPEPVGIAQIVFGLNQALLEPRYEPQLEEVIQHMKERPKGRISIEAYGGPEEKTPETLAEYRAHAVRHYLLQGGAEESRIQVLVGLGGRLGGLRNRTVDIIWLPEGVEY